MKRLAILCAFTCLLLLSSVAALRSVTPAAAQGSDNYILEWFTSSGGGEPSGSDRFVVSGTLLEVNPSLPEPSSDRYVVSGGYWPGAGPLMAHGVYLPLVLRH
jgi:hypothetical protein